MLLCYAKFSDSLPFCGCQHVECHGQGAVAIRPAKQQEIEAPDSLMGHMVIDKRKQLHFLALPAGDDGIIQHKALYPVPVRERAEICCGPPGKQ